METFKIKPISHHRRSKKGISLLGIIKKICIVFSTLFLFIILGVFVFILFIIKDLPNLSNIDEIIFAESSVIYDRNGVELYTLHGDENRKIISIEKIPDSLVQSTISIEDSEFFEHSGFSIKGYINAFLSEVINLGEHKRGGSTLTQQFIKNTFLNGEKTYTRKIKELILSLQLEWKFTKDEILGLYLNSIPYGSNSFGVEQASLTFFGKSSENLDLAESAILASIPKAPTYYSPYGEHVKTKISLPIEEVTKINVKTYKDLILEIGEENINFGLLPNKINMENGAEIILSGRVNLVLDRMEELGYITKVEKEDAFKKLLGFKFTKYHIDIKAPHFVMYVRDLLEEKYGKEFVQAGGLKIYTTLDYELQKKAEEIIRLQVEKNTKNYQTKNAALISIIPQTGEILVMIGSQNYWDEKNDGNVNVILQRRLPGSSFKPFVYASAFQNGYSPASVIYDLTTDFGNGYKPKNFDGKCSGPITMRKALGNSLNIPAIKTGIIGGLHNVYNLAQKMGISFLKDADWYGAALPLGVAEIRPIDMAGAYSVFANYGVKIELSPFKKIIDKNGNILESMDKHEGKRILDAETAYLITDVLSDPNARGIGWNNMLQLPNIQNAIKTGTSNKKKQDTILPMDGWTIGYTSNLLTVVWAGNNDGSTLGKNADGYFVAAPIWKQFMIEVSKDNPPEKFKKPPGIISSLVSRLSGKLPPSNYPQSLITKDIFSPLNIPKVYDNSIDYINVDKISGDLPNEFTPESALKKVPVVVFHSERINDPNWENPVRQWSQKYAKEYLERFGVKNILTKKPEKISNIHNADNTSNNLELLITSPTQFGIVSKKGVGVWVKIESKYGISYVEYYLEDKLVETKKTSPYKGDIRFPDDVKEGDVFSIKVIAYDTLLNTSSSTVQVKVDIDDQAPQTKIIYPLSNDSFAASSIITIQTDTYDQRSDIKKVEFYFNNIKYSVSTTSPYNSNIQMPSESGTYPIKVIAYDQSENTAEDEIKIQVTQKMVSKNLFVEVPELIDKSKSEKIIFGVPIEDIPLLSKVILFIRYKSTNNIETEDQPLVEINNIDVNANGFFEYFWTNPQEGEYDIFVKTFFKNGKVLYSAKSRTTVK